MKKYCLNPLFSLVVSQIDVINTKILYISKTVGEGNQHKDTFLLIKTMGDHNHYKNTFLLVKLLEITDKLEVTFTPLSWF